MNMEHSQEVYKRFIINFYKENDVLSITTEKGSFSRAELYLAFNKIKEKFLEIKSSGNSTSLNNAKGNIMVDFTRSENEWLKVSTFDIDGFSFDEIELCLDTFNKNYYGTS